MRKIENVSLTKEINNHIGSMELGKAPAYPINTYEELVKLIAHLSYLNKDFLLFFRGQTQDFHNKAGVSTFYPSIYREDNLSQKELEHQFKLLAEASLQLRKLFAQKRIEGYKDVGRKQYIQWSILQHYGVFKTPLLDFTHSIRVACSFAQEDNEREIGFVYVFGLPYFYNRISINSEHDIVNIRLLSICPPDALRPYFQEGYLAGTVDITSEYESKAELDFNNRLICKFVIPNTKKFWGTGIKKIPKLLLMPEGDCIDDLCQSIAPTIQLKLNPDQVGEFLLEWAPFEKALIQMANYQEARTLSLGEATQRLLSREILDIDQARQIDRLRRFRNILVHEPDKAELDIVEKYIQELLQLRKSLKLSNISKN